MWFGKRDTSYGWITYEKADELLTNFSKGLNILNLCPIINIEKEDPFRFLGIYSRNKKEWLLSFLGAIKDSITIVTIYETLGLIAIEFILEQTQLITTVIEVRHGNKTVTDFIKSSLYKSNYI